MDCNGLNLLTMAGNNKKKSPARFLHSPSLNFETMCATLPLHATQDALSLINQVLNGNYLS